MSATPPRWDLSNVYPGLGSPEFMAAMQAFERQVGELERVFNERVPRHGSDSAAVVVQAEEILAAFNALAVQSGTLGPYIASFVTTDSHDMVARRLESEFEQVAVRLKVLGTRFEAWVGSLGSRLEDMISASETLRGHAFALREMAEQSRYLMPEDLEELAAELSLNSTSLWDKLQGVITSQLTADFELDGQVQKLPLPALINLHSHPDEGVRRRAYEAEIALLASVREPLAACMNGVKGTANTLNRRRGRTDALHEPVDRARIDRETLDVMLAAMADSFPIFRTYWLKKAQRLGKDRLAWWDVWAPAPQAGGAKKIYSFDGARDFILKNFGTFSPELRELARRAFDGQWIDAEQRPGKRGGAFCMKVWGPRESRVLSNFDGTLDQVSTLAHELGHAFHNQCHFEAGKTPLQASTPMVLAETASIMCETIVMQAVLAQTTDPAEQLEILETALIGDSQVIVDIYSRYLFEKEVFERREKSELSADDLCDIMARAQIATYGEGVDSQHLHPYMWTWKPHYYRADMSFYNFPYAFGLLFGTGLYAIYKQRGSAFVPDYVNLLASTGEARAADLAARFGIDLRGRKFWDDSLAVIGERIERYCEL
ncbi:MAG: M3 family oligoendopeptidase [Nitrososphaerales archaeon]